MAGADPEAIRERIRRMTELFSEIAGHAETQSRSRCPYRDRSDQCTARFRCRNQRPAPDGAGPAHACGHDGRFDYRSAWEVRPESHERTRERLRRVREEARERRAGRPPDGAE